MDNQNYPLGFYNKMILQDGVSELKKQFIEGLDDDLDSYDKETETAIILDRKDLVRGYPVGEIRISFSEHFENIIKEQEGLLINFIQKQYLSFVKKESSNLFILKFLAEIDRLKAKLGSENNQRKSILNSLARIKAFATQYSNTNEIKAVSFPLENVPDDKLKDFKNSLELNRLIEKGMPFSDFKKLFRAQEIHSKAKWTGNNNELAALSKQLDERFSLGIADHIWLVTESCFESDKLSDMRKLKNTKPKLSLRLKNALAHLE